MRRGDSKVGEGRKGSVVRRAKRILGWPPAAALIAEEPAVQGLQIKTSSGAGDERKPEGQRAEDTSLPAGGEKKKSSPQLDFKANQVKHNARDRRETRQRRLT